MIRVVAVSALPDHHLQLSFSDGVSGVVDFRSELWGKVFEPLKEKAEFERVYITEFGVVAWPCGADFDTYVLHERIATADIPRSQAVH